jgi:hypothetical protein
MNIEELILTNIKIWHEVTKLKDANGKLYKETDLSTEERVKCALKIRELNAKRTELRWEIDKGFNMGANETKIFMGK